MRAVYLVNVKVKLSFGREEIEWQDILIKTSKPCLTEKLSKKRCNPWIGQSKKEEDDAFPHRSINRTGQYADDLDWLFFDIFSYCGKKICLEATKRHISIHVKLTMTRHDYD